MVKIKAILREISKSSKIKDGYRIMNKTDLSKILMTNHITIGHLSNYIKAVTNTYVCFDKKV